MWPLRTVDAPGPHGGTRRGRDPLVALPAVGAPRGGPPLPHVHRVRRRDDPRPRGVLPLMGPEAANLYSRAAASRGDAGGPTPGPRGTRAGPGRGRGLRRGGVQRPPAGAAGPRDHAGRAERRPAPLHGGDSRPPDPREGIAGRPRVDGRGRGEGARVPGGEVDRRGGPQPRPRRPRGGTRRGDGWARRGARGPRVPDPRDGFHGPRRDAVLP